MAQMDRESELKKQNENKNTQVYYLLRSNRLTNGCYMRCSQSEQFPRAPVSYSIASIRMIRNCICIWFVYMRKYGVCLCMHYVSFNNIFILFLHCIGCAYM